MEHAIAIKWVIATDGVMYGVLGVTNINPVNISRNLSDNCHVIGVIFIKIRGPRSVEIGVVILGKGRVYAIDELGQIS
ncbi:hypothetical protein GCM10009096_09690 [Parasphingorhabdus litoris]|uniref:CheW-like domain-containing protein n=1 Tax=Parasphingorhabdus litoris TaxID=394733 RepID=A0ABN1A9D5_9SPHN